MTEEQKKAIYDLLVLTNESKKSNKYPNSTARGTTDIIIEILQRTRP
jgi:hypothetical protein